MESPNLVKELLAARESPAKILEILRARALTPNEFRNDGPISPAPFPYARNSLIADPDCEVMLARWTPGVVCAPHDHGASSGWVFFVEGRFEEIDYRWDGFGLVRGARAIREAGTWAPVRSDEIHSCVCESAGLSLHVYFPRIRAMRVFDLERERTLVVGDDCGAWIPVEATQTRKVTPWPSRAPIARS